jgi:shikimate 5-dehydrogenase
LAPLDVSLDRLPAQAIVGDLIHTLPETPLLAAARERGNLTVNGCRFGQAMPDNGVAAFPPILPRAASSQDE